MPCKSNANACQFSHCEASDINPLFAEAIVAQGGGEVTSASMSVSLGQGVTVAAAVMTTGGNADSALADVLDRVVPAPTSRWAAMVEDAPPAVSYIYSYTYDLCCYTVLLNEVL